MGTKGTLYYNRTVRKRTLIVATKNIRLLKQAVYAKLSGDTTLVNLLGANRIYGRFPPKGVTEYPIVTYETAPDIDRPYRESDESGKITETSIRISIFSDSSKTEESDNIESRIKILLNGQRTLDTDDIICYSCYRDTMSAQMFDPDQQVWITHAEYRTVWAPK